MGRDNSFFRRRKKSPLLQELRRWRTSRLRSDPFVERRFRLEMPAQPVQHVSNVPALPAVFGSVRGSQRDSVRELFVLPAKAGSFGENGTGIHLEALVFTSGIRGGIGRGRMRRMRGPRLFALFGRRRSPNLRRWVFMRILRKSKTRPFIRGNRKLGDFTDVRAMGDEYGDLSSD